MKRWYLGITAIAIMFLAQTAQAHISAVHEASWSTGLAHPFTGLDHMLAMLAIGLWAAQGHGARRWIIPLTFMAAMIVGASLSWAGIGLPLVETGIASSILILGLLIASTARLSLTLSLMLVAIFAVFHGQAHASELPQTASALLYGAGFLFATALLHALGFTMGALIRQVANPFWFRTLGGGIAVAGLVFCVAV
ncbi:MAG: HupE/UreJ family protein [Gammaproteobacteria bacterium]|nr:HupE/UreJ family protein [Gammaproteobacteria bacterium]